MKVLNKKQINQKIKRVAIEILENNYDQRVDLVFLGINNNGMAFAKMLIKELKTFAKMDFPLHQLQVNAANPISDPIGLDIDIDSLKDKSIIIVDDVANTGRTIFYCFEPLLKIIPRSIEIAVLVDRKHKLFPVHVDYFGMTLATTHKEHIDVQLGEEMVVLLD